MIRKGALKARVAIARTLCRARRGFNHEPGGSIRECGARGSKLMVSFVSEARIDG